MSPGDVFCAFCGQRQTSSRVTAKLIVMGTAEMSAQRQSVQTARTSLAGSIQIVGSDPKSISRNTTLLARVSRRHAKIVAQGAQFFIEDLGSANGTVISNQVRLSRGRPHVLVNGDEVKLGETTLKFLVG
jgi:predicted component of type VI protein secretion system